MGTSLYIGRKSENRISTNVGAMIMAVLLAVSSLLTLTEQLDLPWASDGLVSGTVSGGLARVWNSAADTLGSTNYILLKKTAGEAPGCGLFLCIVLVVLAVIAFFAIRSRYVLTLLIFTLPQILLGLICSLHAGAITAALLAVSVIMAAAIMRMEGSFPQTLILGGLTAACVLVLLHAAGIDEIRDSNSRFTAAAADKIYGTDGLGYGDLSLRSRDTGTGEALSVYMTDPQAMYLRGFTGSSFNGTEWRDLNDITYYRSEETMRLLKEAGFNAPGQLAQTGKLAYGEEEGTAVSVRNTGTDTRYAYVPYEITDRGDLSDSLTKGGSVFYHGKFRGFKEYSYTASEQQTDNWTDLAALFFTKALGSDISGETAEYLTLESHYNVFVYENYTYLNLKQRNLLGKTIGTAGDQTKGHIDYKTAIDAIRTYLEENFIYTENLGGELSEDTDGLEDFLTSHKGYDVHFATAATLMFRYYGIPARYAEGYLITPEDAENAADGNISVSREKVHAWTEIYIDGVGFVPIEATPEYYGVMNDADMEVGISNEALMNSFSEAYGNTETREESETEIRENDGGDDALQLLWITLAIALAAAAAAGLFFLLKMLIPVIAAYFARRKLFRGPDTKKAAAAIYGYMEEREFPRNEYVTEVGNRAAYSREEITEEERSKMLGEYNTARKMSKSINRTLNKTMSLFLALMLTVPMILASCAGSGSAGADKGFPEDPTVITKETAAYLMEQVSSPAPGSVGGDWLIKGLMDSGAEVPQSYYDLYYDNVRAEVKSKKGILSEDYYTEYERVIIGLSAIGKSTVVEGYDLAPYLDDYEKVSAQGVNASSYALIAARAAGITLENEDAYIQDILTQMSAESMEKDYAYADYIAIALEALSCYGDRPGVKEYIEKAVETLSSLQQEDGSYGNCESTAECIMALCSLGIDPVKDERFVKDGNSAADGLMVCYLGDGRFCHTPELPEADIMSSEKALLAAGAVRSFGSSNG